MIATPFYQSSAFVEYIVSLMKTVDILNRLGIEWTWTKVTGDAYVDHAKNNIMGEFLDSTCTDLFMIDSDMGWDTDGFMKVLFNNYEYVGATYPKKCDGEFTVAIRTKKDRTPLVTPDGLIEAEWVPGGFVRFQRSAVQRMASAHATLNIHGWCEYTDPSSSKKAGHTANMYECKVQNGARFTEDVIFALKWREIGGKIYCEPRVHLTHTGPFSWAGCYHEFLMKQPRPVMPIGPQFSD